MVEYLPQGFRRFHFLDKTRGFHLVDDLLFRLGLTDKIGIGTGGCDESNQLRSEGR